MSAAEELQRPPRIRLIKIMLVCFLFLFVIGVYIIGGFPCKKGSPLVFSEDSPVKDFASLFSKGRSYSCKAPYILSKGGSYSCKDAYIFSKGGSYSCKDADIFSKGVTCPKIA